MMKTLFTDRILVAAAFVWAEAPAVADWLDILSSLQDFIPNPF